MKINKIFSLTGFLVFLANAGYCSLKEYGITDENLQRTYVAYGKLKIIEPVLKIVSDSRDVPADKLKAIRMSLEAITECEKFARVTKDSWDDAEKKIAANSISEGKGAWKHFGGEDWNDLKTEELDLTASRVIADIIYYQFSLASPKGDLIR